MGLLYSVGHGGRGTSIACLRTAQMRSTGLSCGLYFAPSMRSRRGWAASHRLVILLWWVVPLSRAGPELVWSWDCSG